MTHINARSMNRRDILKSGAAAAALPLLGGRAFAQKTSSRSASSSSARRRLWLDLRPRQGPQGHDRRSSATRSRPPSSRTSPKARTPSACFRELAQQGYKLIFATTFGFGDYMIKVAKQFPDVKFEHGHRLSDRAEPVASTMPSSTKAAPCSAPSPAMMSKSGIGGLYRLLPDPRSGDGHQRLPRSRRGSRTRTSPPRWSWSTPGSIRPRKPTPPAP